MKSVVVVFLLGVLLIGCSTVQVARLDTTLPATKTVDLYQSQYDLAQKSVKEIAYLAYGEPVRPENYTAALGALLKKARQIGADALLVETPLESITNSVVLRGTAMVYQP